jgi:hypothetical protein
MALSSRESAKRRRPLGLGSGAAAADGGVHTAYIHDLSPTGDPAPAAQVDGRAIEALGEALAGSGRPLVVASGLVVVPGRLATQKELGWHPVQPGLIADLDEGHYFTNQPTRHV